MRYLFVVLFFPYLLFADYVWYGDCYEVCSGELPDGSDLGSGDTYNGCIIDGISNSTHYTGYNTSNKLQCPTGYTYDQSCSGCNVCDVGYHLYQDHCVADSHCDSSDPVFQQVYNSGLIACQNPPQGYDFVSYDLSCSYDPATGQTNFTDQCSQAPVSSSSSSVPSSASSSSFPSSASSSAPPSSAPSSSAPPSSAPPSSVPSSSVPSSAPPSSSPVLPPSSTPSNLDLSPVTSRLDTLNNNAQMTNNHLSDIKNNIDNANNKLDNLVNHVDTSNNHLSDIKNNIDETNNKLDNLVISNQGISDSINNLATSITSGSNNAGVISAIDKLSSDVTSKIDDTNGKLDDIESDLKDNLYDDSLDPNDINFSDGHTQFFTLQNDVENAVNNMRFGDVLGIANYSASSVTFTDVPLIWGATIPIGTFMQNVDISLIRSVFMLFAVIMGFAHVMRGS